MELVIFKPPPLRTQLLFRFLSATEYHSDADYNSRRVGVVVVDVVVVVVVTDFKKWITFLCFDRFGSYLVGGQK